MLCGIKILSSSFTTRRTLCTSLTCFFKTMGPDRFDMLLTRPTPVSEDDMNVEHMAVFLNCHLGFYYVRANDKTKFLFRSLLYLGDMVLSMTSHQQALAALLDEHSSLTGLRVKTLGGADFPGGECVFAICHIEKFSILRDEITGYHFHRKKEIDFMKDVATGKHVPYLLHMSWTTNKR